MYEYSILGESWDPRYGFAFDQPDEDSDYETPDVPDIAEMEEGEI